LLTALALFIVAYFVFFHPDQDAFTAKYRMIGERMTPTEALQLLGPSYDAGSPNPFGPYTYHWISEDGEKTIEVTWDLTSSPFEKRLLTRDNTAIFSERWPLPPSWWERFLSSVGLR